MKSILLSPLVAFGLILAGTGCARAAGPSPDRQAVEVERFFMAGIERFNAHDLNAFVAQFDDNMRMFAVSEWLDGRAAIHGRFAQTFRDFPNVRMEIEGLAARSVAPGVVTVSFRFRTYPAGSGPAFHGIGSGVYVRRGRGWREVLEHETVTRRDPGMAPPPR